MAPVNPVESLGCKPKYRANIIHHFIFVFFVLFFCFFSYHSFCRKDQFTVFILALKILLIQVYY